MTFLAAHNLESKGDLPESSKEEREIKADLLGDDLGDVAIGQKVRVIAPVLGNQVLYGEIAEIYPHAEEKLSTLGVLQRRVPVIIKLDNAANLKPGYEIRVSVKV